MRRARALLSVLLCAGACLPAGDGPAGHLFEGPTMGTTFAVRVVADDLSDERAAALRAAIEGTLARVDERMSTYRPESEVSRFNRARSTEPFRVSADTLAVLRHALEISVPFRVSADTLAVLRHALEISELTDGAFDVTVGPLVDAWGFGPAGEPAAPPTGRDIDRLRRQVGFRQLRIEPATSSIRKLVPRLSCDLSALAKGYAVDRLAERLRAEGFASYLVEVGGEVRAGGLSPRGDAWRVGIERPAPGPPAVQRLVRLRDRALATSGDYRNYYEVDGRRVSHTIDPRSGRPVDHGLASVSVVEPLCVRADAIATALGVLGPDAGYELAVAQGWAALLIVRGDDGTLRERETPAFAALVE